MIIDYLDGASPSELEVDLCIVGAGAAGIAIAHAFIGTSVSVCILESGGLGGEQRSQELCEGSSIGSPPFDPGISRMRAFGGSCNLWGGGCIPLSQLDLSQRDWVPHSGWPLSYAELEPYYERARSFCHIESHDFAPGSFLTPLARQPPPLDASKLVNQTFVSTTVIFGAAYRAALEQAPNVTVMLHANLLELQAAADGSTVRQAAIGSVDGRRGVVRARHYVLACGGIENARLLLLSNSVAPEGLGNQHDLVGRYFMDHPSGKLGTLFADTVDRFARPYDRDLGKGATAPYPEIGLSEEAQRTHRLLCARVHPFTVEGPVPAGLRALRSFRAARRKPVEDENYAVSERLCAALSNHTLRNGNGSSAVPSKESVGRLALRLGLGVGDVAMAFVRKWADQPSVKSDHVALIGYFEQAPNPHSRITLADERDALGQQKVCVDWQLSALDRHSYRTAGMLFGNELARACGGQFRPEPWLSEGDNAVPQVRGTAHHLGTTRMSDDARQGVVDRQCRVHGIDNLHVAGSSVFPTGGWAFPTLTIIALSLRLAEQLRDLITVRAPVA